MQLTNKQWKAVRKFVSNRSVNRSKRGRPPLDKRDVVNGILWVLTKGARWKQMPDSYPQYQTCRNYFYEWSKTGAIMEVLQVLAANDSEEEEAMPAEFESNAVLTEGCHLSKKKLSEFVQKIEDAHEGEGL